MSFAYRHSSVKFAQKTRKSTYNTNQTSVPFQEVHLSGCFLGAETFNHAISRGEGISIPKMLLI
jgi:hypothetical protein